MKLLVVGIGALGGVIGGRLIAAGTPVWLATRTRETADRLKSAGLSVSGVGGSVSIRVERVVTLDELVNEPPFDLVILATKAHDAIATARAAIRLVRDGGTVLPIQNGAVSEMLAAEYGTGHILGAVSNLGATMAEPGVYEQRNAGHLLIGEVDGGESARVARVREALRGVDTRSTPNIRGAIWSKLILNCSVTTIGAIAGVTMRNYIATHAGRTLFDSVYAETLAVASAAGATPERMMVDPVPPAHDSDADAYARWLDTLLGAYGDSKPSMLQDFEHGRRTEVDYINGYVAGIGRRLGVPTPFNDALVETIGAISDGHEQPHPALIARILDAASSDCVVK